MKITPCWFVGNWIAALFRCRLRFRLRKVWATLHPPRCQRRSTQHRPTSPTRTLPAPVAARAAMVVAGWITALPAAAPEKAVLPLEAALAPEKVVPAPAAGAAPVKAPAAAAKVSN